MRDILQAFLGKTLRIYTVSGVESDLGTLEDVKEDHVVITSHFKKKKHTYLSGPSKALRKKLKIPKLDLGGNSVPLS